MTSWPEALCHGTVGREEVLRMPRGLQPRQALLALAGRLVGMLGAGIEGPVLTVRHP